MIYYDDGLATIRHGDVRDELREMPEASVHTCITSPPYWGLREYDVPASVWGGNPRCRHEWGPAGMVRGGAHRHGASSALPGRRANALHEQIRHASTGSFCRWCGAWQGQLGLEPTPQLYVEHLVEVFRAVRRVLRKDGTVWLNMGDTYTDGGRGSDSGSTLGGTRHNQRESRKVSIRAAYKALPMKNLVGVPWRTALALQDDGWVLRIDNIWEKDNVVPESASDRPSRNHEYIFMFSRQRRYFYDQYAVREPSTTADEGGWDDGRNGHRGGESHAGSGTSTRKFGDPAWRNLRSVWKIRTTPFHETHYSTFPAELVVKPILASTSERGACPACGAPHRRMLDVSYVKSRGHAKGSVVGRREPTGVNGRDGHRLPRVAKQVRHLGWAPTCRCPDANQPVPCVVLDPLGGAMTTVMVAKNLGRHGIGIDAGERYCAMGASRVPQHVLPLQPAGLPPTATAADQPSLIEIPETAAVEEDSTAPAGVELEEVTA